MKKDQEHLYFVTISDNYLNYLRTYDEKTPQKDNRTYIGVLLKIGDKEYFAPLSSPKEKHKKMVEQIDFFKLDGGKLGAINFNNMLPVISHEKCREKINLKFLNKSNNLKDREYYFLLRKQMKFCIKNKNKLLYKAKNLYKLFSKNFEKMPKWQKRIYPRINNFKLLEFASKEYERLYIKEQHRTNEINNLDQVYLINKAINKNWKSENVLKISNIGGNGLSEEEKESIGQAIEELTEESLIKYFNGKFDAQQLISITDGLYDKLDENQMNLLANPKLNRWKMNEIRKGFVIGLSYEKVRNYSNSELNDKEMFRSRENIENKAKTVTKIVDFRNKSKDKDLER